MKAKFDTETACPLCKDTGATKENSCLCGGSGKFIDAANTLQNSHPNKIITLHSTDGAAGQKLLEQLKKLEAVQDAAETLVCWLTRRGIANTSSELKRLRTALDATKEWRL